MSSLLGAIRRRRRLWVGTAVAGVAASILFSLAVPPEYSATTTLLLQQAGQGDPAQAMATDAQLLGSRTVAAAAIDKLQLRSSPQELRSQSQVTVLTPAILQLKVIGPTSAEAVRRAAGIADVFLQFRREEYVRQSKAEVDALRERAADVTAQLSKVNDAINGFPSRSDARTDAALRDYGELLSQKATLSSQLGQLQQRIDASSVLPASSVAKSRVLDPASADPRSPLKAMAVNVASGLFGGLAAGAGWVVLQALVSDEVRRSDDVAAALQVPLALATRRFAGSARVQRKRFRTHASHPPPDVARVVRTWRGVLPGGNTRKGALTVLSLGGDTEAALFLACTAAELARDGRTVMVVDLSERSLLAAVFAVPAEGTSTVEVPNSSSTFRVTFPPPPSIQHGAPENGAGTSRADDLADARIVLTLVAPPVPTQPFELASEWGTRAAAVVRAGYANPASLRSTRELASGRGLELDHVVVVGADPGDHGGGWPGPARRRSPSAGAEPLRMPSEEPT
ncbi:MAG: Wzz/FepE/Etk N-terminal domain-containing protein [Actinomycetota bacterium]|nr:Wzz/FepE/Etk N-terminal domain-containing protein [Actinomycetota bacterium]